MKSWTTYILKFSIMSFILYYIFTIVSLSEVINTIESAKISYIIIAVFIGLLDRFITACQMKLLTEKQGLLFSLWQIYRINLITRFYGLFLPGQLAGGPIHWYKLSQPENKPAEALASIILFRLVFMIVLTFLGILFWIIDTHSKSNYIIGYGLSAIMISLLIIFYFIFNSRGYNLLRRLLRKFDFSFIPNEIRNKICTLELSINKYHYRSRNLLLKILGLSIISHLMGILVFYLFTLSLEVNISLIISGWVRSITLIMTSIPISLSGIGIREGTLIYLLQPYGFSSSQAVALSLILLARSILIGGVGGLFELKNLLQLDLSRTEAKKNCYRVQKLINTIWLRYLTKNTKI